MDVGFLSDEQSFATAPAAQPSKMPSVVHPQRLPPNCYFAIEDLVRSNENG